MEEMGENQMAAPQLCKNGCGFYGSPNFEDLCSKCYRDIHKNDDKLMSLPLSSSNSNTKDVTPANHNSEIPKSSPIIIQDDKAYSSPINTPSSNQSNGFLSSGISASPSSPICTSTSDSDTPRKKKTKCAICKKRLGLTGFTCRCGGVYCSTHRYADGHDCQFDYKTYGQEQLRKANPVVIGEKVNKI